MSVALPADDALRGFSGFNVQPIEVPPATGSAPGFLQDQSDHMDGFAQVCANRVDKCEVAQVHGPYDDHENLTRNGGQLDVFVAFSISQAGESTSFVHVSAANLDRGFAALGFRCTRLLKARRKDRNGQQYILTLQAKNGNELHKLHSLKCKGANRQGECDAYACKVAYADSACAKTNEVSSPLARAFLLPPPSTAVPKKVRCVIHAPPTGDVAFANVAGSNLRLPLSLSGDAAGVIDDVQVKSQASDDAAAHPQIVAKIRGKAGNQ